MRTLDKSKPFGEVCGASQSGARYEQDGVLFDAKGEALNAVEIVIPEGLPPGRPLLPPDVPVSEEETVLSRYRAGLSVKEIAKETGIHHKTVGKIIKDANAQTDIAVG